MRLTLLLLLSGLGRPSFGHAHVRCGLPHASAARCRRPPAGEVFAHGPQLGTELALMDPPQPYKDKDDAAKREFELNRGQAVDTLLADYPSIFAQQSDFSIFHERVVLRDSKGFSLEGIRAYKAFFSVVPTLVNVAFSRVEVSALLMDKYGIDKSRIKIRWRMDLHPRSMGSSLRDVFKWFDTNGDGVISSEEYLDSQERFNDGSRHLTSSKSTGESLVVEGISVYTLNIKGLITRHDIEVTSPTDYPFLEALRELLPVRQGQFSGIPNCFTDPAAAPLLAGAVGVGSAPADAQGRRFSEMTPWLSLAARGAGTAVGTQMYALGSNSGDSDGGGKQSEAGLGQAMLSTFGGKALAKKFKLPKQCEQDYDCNEGGYNWPLRCVDFVFTKICVDPDDNIGGGLGALNWDERDLVQEPIPVRVEDGWLN